MNRKTAIITGGSRGIGAAITRKFASDGYNVVFNYNKSKEPAENVLSQCINMGVEGLLVKMDVTSKDDCFKMVKSAIEKFGRIDVLVNNAGIDGSIGEITNYDEDDFKNVLNTNVLGTFYMTKYASKYMIESKEGGSIINISSIVAKYGSTGVVAYCASKAAIDGFTRSVAKELAEYNINVNAVAPGVTETDMVRNLPQIYKDKMSESIKFKRFCQPEEIACAVSYFAQEEARYTTGQILVVDGSTNL